MNEYRVSLNQEGVNLSFTFDGGPLYAEEDLHELYSAIGRFSLRWAQMEQHVDAIIMHINNPLHSDRLYKEDHPAAFGQKIKTLKRWFNQHPALSELSDHFRVISSRLLEIAKHRNNVLHGTLQSWDDKSETAEFRTLKYGGDDTFHATSHFYELSAIYAYCDMTANTNRYLTHVSNAIFNPEMLEQLKKP